MPRLVPSLALVLASIGAGCREQDQVAVMVVTPAPPSARHAPAVERHAAERPPLAADALPTQATPYVPAQCYTQTQDASGRVHNPCFTCHVTALPPNYIADGDLQLAYDLAPPARVNPWTNLFVDRRAEVAAISDDAIRAYVRRDNYAGDGGPGLAARLTAVPAAWDSDGDGRWSGWTPDVAFAFDARGFDRRGEAYTGWRAYAYYPVPGAFWPTNGSYGDALIRLPAAFRQDAAGHFDLAIYATNLAITEAMIARRDVAIEPTDERAAQVDLDGDGRLGVARVVRYRWRPGVVDLTWAGRAGAMRARGEVHLAPGLFPEGTELVHSVRYLDVAAGRVVMAPRMKELRYMVKAGWLSYGSLEHQATAEAREQQQTPDKTRVLAGSTERGIGNRAGWRLQAFIEDAEGELRPQTLAEHAYCIGCHSGVGATDDSVFSFGRKLRGGFQGGWYHPRQRGFEGVAEPMRADGRGEYAYYLAQNGAGDDLRENAEVAARFFDARGALRPDVAARLRRDVSPLLLPSPARALLLDKAYRVIVRAQSFVAGRDATVTPAVHLHRALGEGTSTGVATPIADRRRPPVRPALRARP
jgi:hypothetical protein